MIKVKCYGTYIAGVQGNGELLDFNVEGLIGDCPDGWVLSLVKNRFVEEWINADKKNKRVQKIQQVFIESQEKVNDDDGVSGKNILEMDWDELRLLACKFGKAMLPVSIKNKAPLKTAREKAAQLYLEKVKGVDIKDIEDIYRTKPNGDTFLDWTGKEVIVDHDDEAPEEEKKLTLADVVGKKKKSKAKPKVEEIE